MQGVTTWETTLHVETQATEAGMKMRWHGQPLDHVAAIKGTERDDLGSHLYKSPEHEPSSNQLKEACDDMVNPLTMSPHIIIRPKKVEFWAQQHPRL